MGNIRTCGPGILLPALLLISALFMWLPVRPAHAFHHPPALAQSLTHAARAMSVGSVGTDPPPSNQGVAGNYWISGLSGAQGIPTYDSIGTGNLGYAGCTVWKKVPVQGGAVWQKTAGINVTMTVVIQSGTSNDKAWPSSNVPNSSTVTFTSLAGGAVSVPWVGEADFGNRTVIWSADAGSNQINRNQTVYAAGGGDTVVNSLKHSRFAYGTSHTNVMNPWPSQSVSHASFTVCGCAGYVEQPGVQGSYGPPSDFNKFRLYIEVLDGLGDPTWKNDWGANGGDPNGTPDLIVTSGADGDLTSAYTISLPQNNGGYDVHTALQYSKKNIFGQWSAWDTIYWWDSSGHGTLIEAKRHFVDF